MACVLRRLRSSRQTMTTFLDRYPDCPSPLELSGLKTWALESGNLLGRYFLDKFTFGVNLHRR